MKISWTRKSKLLVLAIAFCASALLFVGTSLLWRSQDVLYLAVAGPTAEDNVAGQQMVRGIELYLNRLNHDGGINGKKVELKIFDDRNDPQVAREVATKITESTAALAVLGHFYSSTSLVAGEVYQQGGIPAISASATADLVTQNNNWYSLVIFSNRLQAKFIANYVHQVLAQSNASIVYSDDDYGQTLRDSFRDTFTGLGGNIVYQWGIDVDAANFAQQQQQIMTDLQTQAKPPGIIFFATHNDDVVELIVQMKRRQLDYQAIGSDSLGSVAFAQKFRAYPEELAQPGYFSDGIFAVSPIIFDVANAQAQRFRNEYILKYDSEPGWAAATYYDAASIAVNAIARANLTNEIDLATARTKVQQALNQTNSPDTAVRGLNGKLYFEPGGDFDNSIYIGTFSQQQFISAFTQLQPIENLKTVENLAAELADGRILKVDGKYRYRTNIVYTGIDINEIRNLDEKTSSYLMDFYLWFRWQGDIDADKIEFSNYGTSRMDSGDKLELDEAIDSEEVDGVKYRVYRVKADFQEEFWFHDYPFDRQKLAVRFRHANQTRDNIVYVVDVVGMRDTVAQEVLNNWRESKVFDREHPTF
ncbi:MAG: ABC transporter substrate-binding protein [Cyanobacteria bacterium J06623_7]